MSGFASRILLIASLISGGSMTAAAYPGLDAARPAPPVPSATALTDTTPTLAPMAFVQFCMSYQDQCVETASANTIKLDSETWETLQRVNREVNDAIAPDASKDGYGWSLDTRLGNCNDYAVQKRQALIRHGFPMAALSLAVVRTAFGEGHLVLTVRTDRGDFVLDNRRTTITAWNRTGYSWLKRQSSENPQHWVAVQGRPASGGSQPSVRVAAVSVPESRTAAGASGTTDQSAPAEWTASVPLPSIGLAALRLDTPPSGFLPIGTGMISATIGPAAAGRPFAMLALTPPEGWNTARSVVGIPG